MGLAQWPLTLVSPGRELGPLSAGLEEAMTAAGAVCLVLGLLCDQILCCRCHLCMCCGAC